MIMSIISETMIKTQEPVHPEETVNSRSRSKNT